MSIPTIKTLNPFTEEIEKVFEPHTQDQIETFLSDAQRCFSTWRWETFAHRAEIVQGVAEEMRKNKQKYAELITKEMGKPYRESLIEVDYSANIFEYFAKNAEQFLATYPVQTEKGEAYVVSEPIGVLLGVMPWNFPFSQIARFVAPNLMAGNSIVLKTASNIPQCGMAYDEIFAAVQAPKGLYKNLLISGSKVGQLIDNPIIKGVSLTGSDVAGASVGEIAGRNIKRSVLELGGSDPMIVLADADLEKVMKGTINGRLRNAGQACTSSKRIIVHRSLYDTYKEQLLTYMKNMKVGNPMEEDTLMGPVCTKGALEKLLQQINDSRAKGVQVTLGGERMHEKGFFLAPTVLENITKGTPAYDEEIFGPVVCLFPFDTEEEAITLANDTIYGLGASIYSENIEYAQQLARKIDSGMVYINKQVSSSEELPFGGTKRSGYGRELSKAGIEEFVNKKLIFTLR
ncbi:NAD-dependent succinate-semialdehyde dehydrogenase [Weeksella virosa]|uniref:NAD-dependent succinate-semialdehyde dehydrogenase n=1 Tax=Weeksella virosa TaxID=1014 RepID=UPI000DFC2BE4|nr:NAD-dependent succinate-semialdehyde dehydrogenase [Weeksella virosa]MDK7675980.1 NAD-dependent succinate-semialdehyde dehydrogenase [Weeksella virosa]SUP53441.1 Succinate-semialdehyde dehydrogenase [NADP(+)] 1 [Weeksella virosa]